MIRTSASRGEFWAPQATPGVTKPLCGRWQSRIGAALVVEPRGRCPKLCAALPPTISHQRSLPRAPRPPCVRLLLRRVMTRGGEVLRTLCEKRVRRGRRVGTVGPLRSLPPEPADSSLPPRSTGALRPPPAPAHPVVTASDRREAAARRLPPPKSAWTRPVSTVSSLTRGCRHPFLGGP